MYVRNKWFHNFLFASSLFILVGCNTYNDKQEVDNECEQWKVLRQAFAELLKNDYGAYLTYVDSTQLLNEKAHLLKDALKQKYASENYSKNCRFLFSKLYMLADDTAEVYFTIMDYDTIYAMQKMRLSDGKWKILLF